MLGALSATAALTFRLRGQRGFAPTAIALVCIVSTQVVFWSATFPVNVATENWTLLPENWQQLRARWEYSHAASAVLNLGALIAASIAVLRSDSFKR